MIRTQYVSLEDVPERTRNSPKGSIRVELDRFSASDKAAMEVLWQGHYKDAYIASRVWSDAIKRDKFHMRATTRKGRVFIIKTTAE